MSRRQAHAHVTGVPNSTRLTDLLLPIKQGREREREIEKVWRAREREREWVGLLGVKGGRQI